MSNACREAVLDTESRFKSVEIKMQMLAVCALLASVDMCKADRSPIVDNYIAVHSVKRAQFAAAHLCTIICMHISQFERPGTPRSTLKQLILEEVLHYTAVNAQACAAAAARRSSHVSAKRLLDQLASTGTSLVDTPIRSDDSFASAGVADISEGESSGLSEPGPMSSLSSLAHAHEDPSLFAEQRHVVARGATQTDDALADRLGSTLHLSAATSVPVKPGRALACADASTTKGTGFVERHVAAKVPRPPADAAKLGAVHHDAVGSKVDR